MLPLSAEMIQLSGAFHWRRLLSCYHCNVAFIVVVVIVLFSRRINNGGVDIGSKAFSPCLSRLLEDVNCALLLLLCPQEVINRVDKQGQINGCRPVDKIVTSTQLLPNLSNSKGEKGKVDLGNFSLLQEGNTTIVPSYFPSVDCTEENWRRCNPD